MDLHRRAHIQPCVRIIVEIVIIVRPLPAMVIYNVYKMQKHAVQLIESAWLDYMYKPGNIGYVKAKSSYFNGT